MTPEGVSAIDYDECVECGVCLRSAVCPSGALFQDELTWPRTLRHLFSNPVSVHASTRVPGRGMEEMKTNDVTGRYRPGVVGLVVEIGRPVLGTRFRQVEIVTRHLAASGLAVDASSPLIPLMSDVATGTFRPDILEEKVLSAIVSCDVPESRLAEALERLEEVQSRIDTVFSVGIIVPSGEAGKQPARQDGERRGYAACLSRSVSLHGKTNIGLGKRSRG